MCIMCITSKAFLFGYRHCPFQLAMNSSFHFGLLLIIRILLLYQMGLYKIPIFLADDGSDNIFRHDIVSYNRIFLFPICQQWIILFDKKSLPYSLAVCYVYFIYHSRIFKYDLKLNNVSLQNRKHFQNKFCAQGLQKCSHQTSVVAAALIYLVSQSGLLQTYGTAKQYCSG